MSTAVTAVLEAGTIVLAVLIVWYLAKVLITKNWWKTTEVDYRGEGTFFVWYERDYKDNPMACPYVLDTKQECHKEDCLKLMELLYRQRKGFTVKFTINKYGMDYYIFEFLPVLNGYTVVYKPKGREPTSDKIVRPEAELLKQLASHNRLAIGPVLITQSTQTDAEKKIST